MAAGLGHLRERSALVWAASWLACVALAVACNDITTASEYTVARMTADGARPRPTNEAGEPIPDEPVDPGPPPEVSVLAPSGLDFGEMACGNPPAARTVEIKNLGDKEISYNAALAQGTVFEVTPPLGVVAVGETAVVTVSTPGISPQGPVGVSSDVLSITTSAAYDKGHALDVKLGVSGALFTVSPAGPFNYGTVTGSRTERFIIRNDGNVPGTLSFSFTTNESNTYSLDVKTPAVIEPGAVIQRTVTSNPPNNGAKIRDGTLTFSSSSQLCGVVPPPIAFKCHNKKKD